MDVQVKDIIMAIWESREAAEAALAYMSPETWFRLISQRYVLTTHNMQNRLICLWLHPVVLGCVLLGRLIHLIESDLLSLLYTGWPPSMSCNRSWQIRFKRMSRPSVVNPMKRKLCLSARSSALLSAGQ